MWLADVVSLSSQSGQNQNNRAGIKPLLSGNASELYDLIVHIKNTDTLTSGKVD